MNRYEPKVSIVIPAYNAANFLSQAIDSALAQTYKNCEIIVVNDGSKDNGATERIVELYGNKVKYVKKENGGSSSALNCGINHMTGEWFSWLSHDDLYYPHKVESEINALNDLLDSGVEKDRLFKHIFFGAADLIDCDGKIIRKETGEKIRSTDRKINCPDGSLKLIAIPTQDGFHGCSCLIHKHAFEEVGMFDEKLRLLNDMDLWFRFYTNGYTVHFVPDVLVCGRVHSQQVSRKIGFSYHNEEQDMFWERSLQWLCDNCSDNYELFYLFAKTATLKTRYKEGKIAFSIVSSLDHSSVIWLRIKQSVFIMFAFFKDLMKRAYLFLFA